MVDERLEPLRERLGLSKKELKKMVLSSTDSLTIPHDSLLTKLDRLQAHLGMNDAELKKIVLKQPQLLGYNHDSLVNGKLELGPCTCPPSVHGISGIRISAFPSLVVARSTALVQIPYLRVSPPVAANTS